MKKIITVLEYMASIALAMLLIAEGFYIFMIVTLERTQ
jgi:hypothetical protein